jgi:hypothetical protein
MFISERKFHLTNQFCKIELGPSLNSKMIPESPPRSAGPPPIKFFIRPPTIYIRAREGMYLRVELGPTLNSQPTLKLAYNSSPYIKIEFLFLNLMKSHIHIFFLSTQRNNVISTIQFKILYL